MWRHHVTSQWRFCESSPSTCLRRRNVRWLWRNSRSHYDVTDWCHWNVTVGHHETSPCVVTMTFLRVLTLHVSATSQCEVIVTEQLTYLLHNCYVSFSAGLDGGKRPALPFIIKLSAITIKPMSRVLFKPRQCCHYRYYEHLLEHTGPEVWKDRAKWMINLEK